MRDPRWEDGAVTIVPANEASWEDLAAIFGTRGYSSRCQCQRFKVGPSDWTPVPIEDRAFQLRMQTDCGHPESDTTSGLVAYLDGEPVGWCAVEPRIAYARLPPARVAWAARGEDMDDATVWAATCFVTRAGYRRRGISRALARAAVAFARGRGARALEGYPMITEPGKEITWGELHVGSRTIFAAAGFMEVSHPTLRRMVMRIDFGKPRAARTGGSPMTATLLDDAFAHHAWATEVLIDACASLTPEQLQTPAPGTYGSILDTFRHLVRSDGWYLSFFREQPAAIGEDAEASLAELRSAITINGTAWTDLLAGNPDSEADIVEHGDGWDFHSPLGFRLAQVIQHGTDHRSQICTALTSLGVDPPAIDLWSYGEATGRTRAVEF